MVQDDGQDERMTTDQGERDQALVDAVAAQFAEGGIDVENAARVILRAITARHPRAYCRIGNDARLMSVLSRAMSPGLQDGFVAKIVDAKTMPSAH